MKEHIIGTCIYFGFVIGVSKMLFHAYRYRDGSESIFMKEDYSRWDAIKTGCPSTIFSSMFLLTPEYIHRSRKESRDKMKKILDGVAELEGLPTPMFKVKINGAVNDQKEILR